MQRIRFIDGLRGILALIVFFHHFILMFFPAYYYGCNNALEGFSVAPTVYKTVAYSPLNLFINGNFAVVFFFVLSGYVLSVKYSQQFSASSLAADVFKRYFRLSIPIFGSCLLVYLAHRLSLFHQMFVPASGMNGSWLSNLFKQDLSLLHVFTFSFFDAVLLGKTPYSSVLWTMVFEFFGALLIYVFLFINQFNRRPILVITFFAVLAFCVGGIYLLPFCLGLLLTYMQERKMVPVRAALRRVFFLLLVLTGIYFASYPSAPYEVVGLHLHKWIRIGHFPAAALYQSIGCALLFFVILNSCICQRILSFRPFLFIGKLSFSVYLTHLLVLCTFSAWLFEKLYLKHSFVQSAQTVFGCTLVAVIGMAFLFYKAVEQPTPRFAKWIATKIFRFGE